MDALEGSARNTNWAGGEERPPERKMWLFGRHIEGEEGGGIRDWSVEPH